MDADMTDELLAKVRANLPGSRINDKTLQTVIAAVRPILQPEGLPPPSPVLARNMAQIGWLCNGEIVPGGMAVEPAAHWKPVYVEVPAE